MLQIPAIADRCNIVHLPWLFYGSQGQLSHPREERLFPRVKALQRIRTWINDSHSPGKVLVITGPPGVGKSAVLTMAALESEGNLPGAGLFFDAHDATKLQLLRAVGELLDLPDRGESEAVARDIRDSELRDKCVVMVDGLDEGARGERREMARALVELARVPGLRVVVATRRRAPDATQLTAGGFLKELGATPTGDGNLIDLDDEEYFDLPALVDFTTDLLAQQAEDIDEQPDQRDQVVNDVIARAGRNFLVAKLTVKGWQRGSAIDQDGQEEPDSVDHALERYLRRLPEDQQALLGALAYARGPGISDALWIRFAEALDVVVTRRALIQLRAGWGADYLAVTPMAGGQAVTRLFHRALADLLMKTGPERTEREKLVFDALSAEVRRGGGWSHADDYARSYAPVHALSAGELTQVLEDDPAFAAYVNLERLIGSITHLSPEQRSPMVLVVLRAAGRGAQLGPRARAQLFALAAAHLGLPEIADKFKTVAGAGLAPVWAHSLGQPHQELIGHTRVVRDVRLGHLGSKNVIASCSADGSVRVWDENGDPLFAPLRGSDGEVRSVAIGHLTGDGDVVVSGGRDHSVWIWNSRGELIRTFPTGTPTNSVAIGELGGRDVIVVGGVNHSVRAWDRHGKLLFEGWHNDEVRSVSIGRLGEHGVIASAGKTTVKLWNAEGTPILGPLRHTEEILSIAVGRMGSEDCIVSGGKDGVVHVWDSEGVEVRQLVGHTNWVHGVAIGKLGLDDDDVIVSGSMDTTIRAWGRDGKEYCDPLFGHAHGITSVAVGRMGVGNLIVSGSRDNTVRIWDPSSSQVGKPVSGHIGGVHSVTVDETNGRDEIIVSAGFDSTVRLWSDKGEARLAPLRGERWGINAATIGLLRGDRVIVAGGYDTALQAWRLNEDPSGVLSADLLWRIPSSHMKSVSGVAVGTLHGQQVVASSSDDGTIKVWDARGNPIGPEWSDGNVPVYGLALGRLDGRDVIVSGSEDGFVRVWTSRTDFFRLKAQLGHVKAVTLGRLQGREVIASAGDRTICILRPDGTPLQVLWGHTAEILALAIGRYRGQEAIVSAGRDCTVRVWDADGKPLTEPFPLLDEAQGVTTCAAGILVATGSALALLR